MTYRQPSTPIVPPSRGNLRVGGLRDSRDQGVNPAGIYWDARYRVPVIAGQEMNLDDLYDAAQTTGRDFRWLYQNRMAQNPRYAALVAEMNRGTPQFGTAPYMPVTAQSLPSEAQGYIVPAPRSFRQGIVGNNSMG